MAINENEFDTKSCAICREDLKTEYIQAISTCGHVFHGLCLQQWLEYCIAKNTTCPVCRQTCSQQDICRLYFQSIGDTIHSQKLLEKGTQEDEFQKLSCECDEGKKLQGKFLALTSSFKHQQRKLKDMSEELNRCKEENKDAQKQACDEIKKLQGENLALTSSLNKCKEKLVKSESTLQQDRLGYRRKLAAVKSALDVILDEEVNLASYGNVDNNKYRLPIPKGGGGGWKAPRTFTKSSYLKAVEDKFQDEKEKYHEIIRVVKALEANKIEFSDAESRVKNILEGYQELVLGFRIFSPKTHFWLKVMTRFENNFNLFVCLQRMQIKGSISSTDAFHEVAFILQHHPDLLDEFKTLYSRSVVPTYRPILGDRRR